MERETRTARFEIVSDEEGYKNNLDYIMLDIPADQLQQVFDKVARCKNIEEDLNNLGRKSPKDCRWVVTLWVRPHHQALPGESSGSEPIWPPSLLRDDIPRDVEKGLVVK